MEEVIFNPFDYRYTPIKNPILRALFVLALAPLQLLWWLFVEVIGGFFAYLGFRIMGGK